MADPVERIDPSTQSIEDTIGELYQGLDEFSAAPATGGPTPTERELGWRRGYCGLGQVCKRDVCGRGRCDRDAFEQGILSERMEFRER